MTPRVATVLQHLSGGIAIACTHCASICAIRECDRVKCAAAQNTWSFGVCQLSLAAALRGFVVGSVITAAVSCRVVYPLTQTCSAARHSRWKRCPVAGRFNTCYRIRQSVLSEKNQLAAQHENSRANQDEPGTEQFPLTKCLKHHGFTFRAGGEYVTDCVRQYQPVLIDNGPCSLKYVSKIVGSLPDEDEKPSHLSDF